MTSAAAHRALFATTCCLPVLAGCKPASPPLANASSENSSPPASVSAVHMSRAAASPTIQTNPQYKEAVRLFKSGDRIAAAKIINQLLATPSLSATDQEFLQHQKALCETKPALDVIPTLSEAKGRNPQPT